MSEEEEPAPSAPGLEIGNDDAFSDEDQVSLAHKHRKTGLTMCDDGYTVSWRTCKRDPKIFLSHQSYVGGIWAKYLSKISQHFRQR